MEFLDTFWVIVSHILCLKNPLLSSEDSGRIWKMILSDPKITFLLTKLPTNNRYYVNVW